MCREPEENLRNCQDAIREFEQRQKERRAHTAAADVSNMSQHQQQQQQEQVSLAAPAAAVSAQAESSAVITTKRFRAPASSRGAAPSLRLPVSRTPLRLSFEFIAQLNRQFLERFIRDAGVTLDSRWSNDLRGRLEAEAQVLNIGGASVPDLIKQIKEILNEQQARTSSSPKQLQSDSNFNEREEMFGDEPEQQQLQKPHHPQQASSSIPQHLQSHLPPLSLLLQAAAGTLNPKFNLTNIVQPGSLMLTEDEVDGVQGCYTLRQVEKVTPEGVSKQSEQSGGKGQGSGPLADTMCWCML